LSTIRDIEKRRGDIENSPEDHRQSTVSEGDLPSTVADAFAQHVEKILKDWHFPDAARVFFDAKSRDLVIAGNREPLAARDFERSPMRHFTVGLLDFCRSEGTHHPGFVVLDSPLLAYRKPEGKEDDLTGTDLDEQFYGYLANAKTTVKLS